MSGRAGPRTSELSEPFFQDSHRPPVSLTLPSLHFLQLDKRHVHPKTHCVIQSTVSTQSTLSTRAVARGGGGVGSYCLMSIEVQFGKMKKFWTWTVMMVAPQGE